MACLVGKNSCLINCNDVAAKLISALENNDIEEFGKLLDDAKPEEINKHHEYPHNATCLQLACRKGQADFVELLIKHRAEVDTYTRGADPPPGPRGVPPQPIQISPPQIFEGGEFHSIPPLQNMAKRSYSSRPPPPSAPLTYTATKSTHALHMACYNAHHDCVELLLKAGADVNLRDDFARQTPLHATLSCWRHFEDSQAIKCPTLANLTEKKFGECFQLLLRSGRVELEAKTDGGRTPLEDAVHYENVSAIKTLISYGAKVNARVREEARDLKMPENENVINLIAQKDQPPGELEPIDEIRGMIRRKDHVQLQELLRSLKGHLDDKNRRYPCVRYCINEGSVECLQALLDAGADPNLSSKFESYPPIITAATRGEAQMLKILLDNPRTDINACEDHKQQTALHLVVRALSRSKDSKYLECLSILLESKAININSPDRMGNTALHYAAGLGVEEAVLLLLHHGASLGSKNCFNKTPIKNILPSTLETFLDECMEQSENKGRASRDYYITFKYNFLARQKEPRKRGNSIPEGGSNPESSHLLEEGRERGNPSPETASPFQNASNSEHAKGDYYSESENLWYLSCSSRHKHLLRHPVVSSFLLLKWHKKIRRYFYPNLAFFVFTVAILTKYVLEWEQTTDQQIGLNILWYLLAILVAILFLREFFQIGIAPMRYLCRIANYLELGMIFNTAMILYYSHESESVRPYAAMAVICAYISSMLLLGQHPTWSLLKEACTCVTRSFFKLLLWYGILIFGFILSFYILFKSPTSSNTDESPANGTTSKPAQNNETQNFQTLPLTTLKMVAMMTGELNFDDLPFYMTPVISRVIFVIFVFLIPVVLLNLLNGLAVSDIQRIYSEAETVKYANLVQLVSYTEMIESILLGDPFHFLSNNYLPFSCLRLYLPVANYCRKVLRIPSLCPFMQSFSTLLFDRRLPYTKWSSDCLPAKAYKVYYNRVPRASRKDVVDLKCRCRDSFSLPDEIIEAACDRLKAMHSAKDPGPLAIQALKDQFDELKQEIKSLSENQVEIKRLLQRA